MVIGAGVEYNMQGSVCKAQDVVCRVQGVGRRMPGALRAPHHVNCATSGAGQHNWTPCLNSAMARARAVVGAGARAGILVAHNNHPICGPLYSQAATAAAPLAHRRPWMSEAHCLHGGVVPLMS